MPMKQSKEQQRLSKSRTTTQAASSPTSTNADKTGVFWNQRGVEESSGGGITNSKKSERWTKGGRDFCDSAPSILEELQKQSEDFRAGQIRFCLAQWKQITIDEKNPQDGRRGDIEFVELPVQENRHTTIYFPQNKYMCWFGSVGIAEEGSGKKSTSLKQGTNISNLCAT